MQQTIQYIEAELAGLYPETEIKAITRILLEHFTGMSFTEQLLNRHKQVETKVFEKIRAAVSRLKKHEPVQYIVGETVFFGLKIKVNPSVLIPRPETEELVDLVLDKISGRKLSVLDIGTGSGCIALAIASRLNDSVVSGTDISPGALETARQNAKANHLDVHFFQSDILNWEKRKWKCYDVIVSNPPYVRESEKTRMLSNVLAFEPAQALFVADDDPLLFYRRILDFAEAYLSAGGSIFFEINEHFGNQMMKILEARQFANIECRKDINGKERFISGVK